MTISRRRTTFACRLSISAAVLALLALAPAASAFDPVVEAKNFSKTQERETIWDTAQYQLQLRETGAANAQRAILTQASDPERNFIGFHLCATGDDGCAGDVRLYDWESKGYGIVEPVLFTARSGATISGHVWATKAGPSKRPGIVITNGSVQAPEQLYWFAAQTLAKAGYVVLTTDPQGQGQSDERGEAPDENEGSPAQTDGRPFFDGTRDALDFFLSTPSNLFKPRPSCESGTSHAPKQIRRVAAGLNTALQPVLEDAEPAADRACRALVRGRRRVVHRAAGPAGERDRGVGQPRAARHQRRPPREALPRRSREPRGRDDHEAGARHGGRLRPRADAVHRGPGPAREEPGRHSTTRRRAWTPASS